LPYKGLGSFKIEEDSVRKWAGDLNPNTINYVHYLLKYLEWAKAEGYWLSAQEMLKEHAKLSRSTDQKKKYKHLDILSSYIKNKGTGSSDRRNTWHAVSGFYSYHRRPLPTLARLESEKLFKPSERDTKRALDLPPLSPEEVRQLVLNAAMPYKAIFAVMFQGAMGLAELSQFNSNWQKITNQLDEPGPLKIDLYRSKTSRKAVQRFYTFISQDAKDLIKQWLQVRPKSEFPHLFLTFRKNDRKWVPTSSHNVGENVTVTAKRIGLIRQPESSSSANRYHVHPHEFRDLFKSLCQLHGVLPVASEYFLGHQIDSSGYDKSPEYDVEFFRNEYRKVEPYLNIISGTGEGMSKKAIAAMIIQQFLTMVGYSEEEIGQFGDLSSKTPEEIQDLIQKKSMQALGLNGNSKQKIVPMNELKQWVTQGWEYVSSLPTNEAIIKLP
jgi:integrase